MPRFDGVIFDLDGTLLDTLGDIATSMNGALREHGEKTYPLSAYHDLVGGGLREMIVKALRRDPGDELVDSITTAFHRRYREEYANTSRPYEGIVPMLEQLHAASVKLAVLSNKPDVFTKEMTAALLPEGYFVEVLGQTERFPVKPEPQSAWHVLEMMGVTRERAAYVGDSNVDMYTAKNAELTAIGVEWGFRPAELPAAGADYMASSPLELAKWVLQG